MPNAQLNFQGLTLLIVVIARVGFPEKSPPTGWSTDHEESFTLAISEQFSRMDSYGVNHVGTGSARFTQPLTKQYC